MTPFLWLVWAILAVIVLFIAAAVVHTIIEKYRELPPRRGWRDVGYIEDTGVAIEPPANVRFRKATQHDRLHWSMKPDETALDHIGPDDLPKPDGSQR